MITRIKSDLIVLPGGITSGYVYFEDGVITAVGTEELAFGKEYDFTGRYVSPGFIDIHTHGGGGYDFSKSKEDVIGAANFHLYHGTTSIMPTVSAAPIEYMEKAAEFIEVAATLLEIKSKYLIPQEKELMDEGFYFRSDSDSEVICYMLKKEHYDNNKDIQAGMESDEAEQDLHRK